MELNKLSFLVIDDFDNVRKSIRGMLTQLGVSKIVEARDAVEAFRAVRNQYFDVILCDYNLGPGRDGQQLLEMVRTDKIISFRTIYVMITAETTRSMVMGALEFEPDDYMAKPFALETLIRRLERWLNRQATLTPVLDMIDKGEHGAAIKALRELMQSAPRYRAWAQRQLVELLMQERDYPAAEKELLEAQAQREQAWIGFMLAKIRFLHKDYAGAIDALNNLTMKYPNFVKAYDLLAVCHERLEQLEEARAAVSDGVRVSPRSVARQLRLAELSEKLDDPQAAAVAMKRVVKLLENSPKDDAIHFDRLLKNLQLAASNATEDQEKTELFRDASRYLDRMQKRFVKDPDALIRAQIHKLKMAAQAARQSTASRLLELGRKQLDSASPELLLELMQAFYDADMANMANEWALELNQRFAAEPEILSQIMELQAEPISTEAKAKVHAINSSAIQAYKEGKYQEAERLYQQALQISPRQAGLVLNYVQALLQLALTGNQVRKRVELAEQLLQRLEYVNKHHPQFARLQTLEQKVREMKEKIANA